MPLELIQRHSPTIVTLPYTGTNIPRVIADRLHDPTKCITAPDRFLDRLLHGLMDEANTLRVNFHRYLSDVDRVPPSGDYHPQKDMLGAVPLLDAQGDPIWDNPPSKKESMTWRAMYYAPFHAALAAQVARARARHGYALLVNCRAQPEMIGMPSLRDEVDIGISTYMGTSPAIELSTQLVRLVTSGGLYSAAVHGRVMPGWITRHYGRPTAGVHAIDLDLNERCYLALDQDAALYNTEGAEAFRKALREVMDFLTNWRPPELR